MASVETLSDLWRVNGLEGKMDKKELQRVCPESVGLSSKKILEFLKELENSGTEMHGIMIARHGKVLAESWWLPYLKDMPHCCHSMGKSYMGAAAGIAYDEGLLNPDEKIVDIFREEIEQKQIPIDAHMQEMTVRNLLSMSSGMRKVPSMHGDFITNFLAAPVPDEPGTTFLYNSSAVCVLGAILCKKAKEGVKSYVSRRLFEPIGINPEKMFWLKFSNGIDGEPGVYTTTEDNLRLAMLYMNRGKWEGNQILSQEWIDLSTSLQTDTQADEGIDDCKYGYGYLLWKCRIPGVYRFDGAFGQYCIISPKDDMVISITEGAQYPYNVQKTLDIVYQYFFQEKIPETLEDNPVEYYELEKYCRERQLTLQNGVIDRKQGKTFEGTYLLEEGTINIWVELYEDFYRLEKRTADKVKIEMVDEIIRITFDDTFYFEAALDDRYIYTKSPNIIPEQNITCSTAYIDEEEQLHFDINWMNSCLKTYVTIGRTADGIRLSIEKPVMYGEKENAISYCATLKRQG